MTQQNSPTANMTTVAEFPKKYFLENLAVRGDGSILVTVVHQKELWCIPSPGRDGRGEPTLVHTFDHLMTGIAEAEPDVFYVCTTDLYTSHESYLQRVDLREWAPGAPIEPEIVVTFDERVRGLNGSCLLAPGILLIADCFAGLVWRVDLPAEDGGAVASVWLRHESMKHDPDSTLPPPPQPGINGIRYAERTGFVYYTNTARKVFMRVPVVPDTHAAAGDPELVAEISMADDFCIDEDAGAAYVTRHRENTIDRVPLDPQRGTEIERVVGEPFDEQLIGPSSAVWGRGPGEYGRVAFVTTDGGTTAPPPDGIRNAKVLRVELKTPIREP